LWQVLALLYKGQGRPDLSLAIYLQLQLPSVFDFIQEHGLLLCLDRNAYLLMAIDERRALELLTAHLDTLPPGKKLFLGGGGVTAGPSVDNWAPSRARGWLASAEVGTLSPITVLRRQPADHGQRPALELLPAHLGTLPPHVAVAAAISVVAAAAAAASGAVVPGLLDAVSVRV
jgi:hypothetical protein